MTGARDNIVPKAARILKATLNWRERIEIGRFILC